MAAAVQPLLNRIIRRTIRLKRGKSAELSALSPELPHVLLHRYKWMWMIHLFTTATRM